VTGGPDWRDSGNSRKSGDAAGTKRGLKPAKLVQIHPSKNWLIYFQNQSFMRIHAKHCKLCKMA